MTDRAGEIVEVELEVAAKVLPEVAEFYGTTLELLVEQTASEVRVRVGNSVIVFRPASGLGDELHAPPPATAEASAPAEAAPFYHLALRIRGGRLGSATEWLRRRASVSEQVTSCNLLLSAEGSENGIFVFDDVGAVACYLNDPAGNILELISFHDLDPKAAPDAPFRPAEILGVAEVGLVGTDPAAMAAALAGAGLTLWQGTVEEPGRLAFVGRRGSTLILCPTGRGWLPLDRPAGAHPVRVTLVGAEPAEILLHGTGHTVRVRSQSTPVAAPSAV